MVIRIISQFEELKADQEELETTSTILMNQQEKKYSASAVAVVSPFLSEMPISTTEPQSRKAKIYYLNSPTSGRGNIYALSCPYQISPKEQAEVSTDDVVGYASPQPITRQIINFKTPSKPQRGRFIETSTDFPSLSAQDIYGQIIAFQAASQTDSITSLWAQKCLERLRAIATENQLWWHEPLVNISVEAEVVFEWWREHKKLTVYILKDTAEYIKVWGPDIDNEMQEGLAKSCAELTSLWKWMST